MEKDFNGFSPYADFTPNMDFSEMYKDPMFNPVIQYEQAYTYYKYLCMQMDYKIKCKEYERLCLGSISRPNSTDKKPVA